MTAETIPINSSIEELRMLFQSAGVYLANIGSHEFIRRQPLICRSVVVVVIVTVLRVVTLIAARSDLHFDEAQYWYWGQELAFGYFSKPPLLAWIIRLTTELFGNGEAAVRLSSPVLHGLTAIVLMVLAKRLYNERVGAWTAVFWVSLPAVSLSSTLASTDVPLLFSCALALLFFFELRERLRWRTAIGLGIAIGMGLNAKYAMAYFPLCVLAMASLYKSERHILTSPHLWVAFAIASVLLAPNLAWNAANDFATVVHLRDNADWSAGSVQPVKALEFLAGQFAVYGPVPFAVLVGVFWARIRDRVTATELRLLWLSIPIIVLVTFQAYMSRANANWAVTAYPAATILVVATLVNSRWLTIAMVFNVAFLLVFLVTPLLPPTLVDTALGRPFKRFVGWNEMSQEVARRAFEEGIGLVVTTRRRDAAELLYYLRDLPLEIRALHAPGRPPQHHFELTLPWWTDDGRPALLLSESPNFPLAMDTGLAVDWLGPLTVSPGVARQGKLYIGRVH